MKLSFTPTTRRFSFLYGSALRMLPVSLLNGALVQVAHAQNSGGAQTAEPSALYSLVSTLSAFAFVALLIGVVRPKTFAFLFKEKATRGRVCGVFGAAWFFLVILGPPLKPKPVATVPAPTSVPATTQARSAPQANAAPDKNESAVRAAENRAKASEARAVRAEKAAALANASSKAANSKSKNTTAEAVVPKSASPKTAPQDESLPSNVAVLNVPGVGKRQIGEVDDVGYVVISAETAESIGSTQADGMFYVLRVAASNSDKKTHNVTTSIMKLLDDQDREFDPSREGGLALAFSGDQSAQISSAQVQPGVTKQFTLVYDAPDDAKGLKLKIPAGGFGFGQSAVIQVPVIDE